MSVQSTAIRTAIVELLTGAIGSTRVVTTGLFAPGITAGDPIPGQQAKALDHRYTHRFDVAVRSIGNHTASPLSVKASYRISRMAVEVSIWTKLKAATRHADRESQRAQIEGDCDVAIAALNYPNNLNATAASVATGIVSGMLQGPNETATPTWELVEENWSQHLLRSRIVGEADVILPQAVS